MNDLRDVFITILLVELFCFVQICVIGLLASFVWHVILGKPYAKDEAQCDTNTCPST